MKLLRAIHRWFIMRRQCAWCNTYQGGNPFARTSHGICPACLRKQKLALVKPVCAELNDDEMVIAQGNQ